MSKVEDGGPAFPTDKVIGLGSGASRIERSGGMSLRDYFAGQALALSQADYGLNIETPDLRAEEAYRIADAMLRARNGASQ